jgi:hypothetical protein
MTAFVLSDAAEPIVPRGATLAVAFNAPFHTGFTLDTQGLLARDCDEHGAINGYEGHQQRLLERLDDSWRDPGAQRRGGQEFDVDNYSGRPMPPLYLLARQLPGLLEESANAFDVGGLAASVLAVDLKLCDFGVGVITTSVSVTALAELSFTEYRLAVEGMARGGYMDERVRSTVHDTLAALFAVVPEAWLAREIGPDGRPVNPCVGTGQSLWTHRIYDIPVADEAMLADAAHLAWRHLLPLMPEAELHRVVCGDMIFLPEKGSSVALHTPGQAPTALLHTIELQNAYWAGAAKLDRALLRRVAALAYDTRNCDFRELERRTDEVIDFYERARVFEMILHSLVGMLSPLQFSTWEAVAGAWDLQRQLDAVRDKVDALSSIHTALLADASQRRTARLNAGVFVFTVFALAQTLFAAITFGFTGIGAHLTTIHGIAIGITISVGVLCAGIAFTLLRSGVVRRRRAQAFARAGQAAPPRRPAPSTRAGSEI